MGVHPDVPMRECLRAQAYVRKGTALLLATAPQAVDETECLAAMVQKWSAGLPGDNQLMDLLPLWWSGVKPDSVELLVAVTGLNELLVGYLPGMAGAGAPATWMKEKSMGCSSG